jgi:hypothetical protein
METPVPSTRLHLQLEDFYPENEWQNTLAGKETLCHYLEVAEAPYRSESAVDFETPLSSRLVALNVRQPS